MKKYLNDKQIQTLIKLGIQVDYPDVTIYDLLETIPTSLPDELCHFAIMSDMDGSAWTTCYEEEMTDRIIHGFTRDELIDALFDLLCWSIQEGYVTL